MQDLNIEFSTQFDTYYNNVTSNQAPGLNVAEKSMFFTKAQYQVVEGLYNGNLEGHSFEETEELRRKLDTLINTLEIDTTGETPSSYKPLTANSKFVDLSDNNVMFITLEEVQYVSTVPCFGGKKINVKPVRQDEYNIIKDNPFRGVTDRRALRLDYGNKILEIIPKYEISKYFVKYLQYPEPIILDDLSGYGVKIEGSNTENPCKLDKLLHKDIIDRAVLLAKIAWQQTLGNR